jgi:hypothetical protein
LREFLRLAERETVPDHPWLSRTRARLLATSDGARRAPRSICLTFSRAAQIAPLHRLILPIDPIQGGRVDRNALELHPGRLIV